MRWLVRLVTPPGGLVLDPFAGSGTTLQAARDEGFRAVGIERETDYLPLIAHRIGVELHEVLVSVDSTSTESVIEDPVMDAIETAVASRKALLAVWKKFQHDWTDLHTARVKQRLVAVDPMREGVA